MGIWKFSPFLVLSILMLYHVGFFQAAPIGFPVDNCTSPVYEEESEFVLVAVVQGFDQVDDNELDQDKETEDEATITAEKPTCNTTTCLTNELLDLLSISEEMLKTDFPFPELDNLLSDQRPENVTA